MAEFHDAAGWTAWSWECSWSQTNHIPTTGSHVLFLGQDAMLFVAGKYIWIEFALVEGLANDPEKKSP